MTALHKKATGWNSVQTKTNQKPETHLEIVYESNDTDISSKAQNKKNRMESHEKFMRHCYAIERNFHDYVFRREKPTLNRLLGGYPYIIPPYSPKEKFYEVCYQSHLSFKANSKKIGYFGNVDNFIDIDGKCAYYDSLKSEERTVYRRRGLGGSLDYCIFGNADYAD